MSTINNHSYRLDRTHASRVGYSKTGVGDLIQTYCLAGKNGYRRYRGKYDKKYLRFLKRDISHILNRLLIMGE